MQIVSVLCIKGKLTDGEGGRERFEFKLTVQSWSLRLESRCVDSVIHVLDSLLNLELLGVQLVLELINGGFKFADLFKNTSCKDTHIRNWAYHLLSGLSTVLGILEFLLKGLDLLDVLGLLDGVLLGGGLERFQVVGDGLLSA